MWAQGMVENTYNTAANKTTGMMRTLLLAFLVVWGGCGANTGDIPVTPRLASIAITPTSLHIAPGATQQLTATGNYSNGSTADITAAVTWTPNTPLIASINSTGMATGLASGWASFTASLGSVSGSMTVPALVSIAITPSSLSLASGATQQLTATGTYSNGSTVDITASVTWTPNTPLIASINSTGLATGLTAGWSSFTASLGTVSANTTVPVLAVEVEPNDTPAAATPMTPTVTITGQLLSKTDFDYYQLTATGAGAISVVVTADAQLNSFTAGWTISILDPQGNIISSVNCRNCTAQPLNAGISAAGTYYVLVQADTVTYSTFANSTDNYTLTATVP